ncbi:MAG: FAD-dependent oxidoreductase [Desulfohalobiaceae bacterium]|nr:FAD-dependent oxidoreductase [Desulfohalobiaceae bacterium]
MTNKKVLIIGSGAAGLSAAVDLARWNIDVDLLEKTHFPGGHAVQLSCKAVKECVKCGACLLEEKLAFALEHPRITIHTGTQITDISKGQRFTWNAEKQPSFIDPEACTNCGACLESCPWPGALVHGSSRHHSPFYAIREENCRYFKDQSCQRCREVCPEGAIQLNTKRKRHAGEADAVILTTGFKTFDPKDKPYGYGIFQNVVTNMELERMLRQNGAVFRPSDGRRPERIAFIQCVGSRDAKLGHLWCSKVCCGSALRMARFIKHRESDADITVFSMDVQTFGRDFQLVYAAMRETVRLVRAIPGDFFQTENDRLQFAYVDNQHPELVEEAFDLVVLSIGLVPNPETADLARMLGLSSPAGGFIDSARPPVTHGVFPAGTVKGPMGIPESIADAGSAAWQTLQYLQMEARGANNV